jgi:hypothetical protein
MLKKLASIGILSTVAFAAAPVIPFAEANHQFTWKYNDPYSPSTPNLYRRDPRPHTCQLPAQYQAHPAANEFQGWLLPGLIWGDCPLTFRMATPPRSTGYAPFGQP